MVGTISELIYINEFGELYTKFDNTFDYQRQTRVIFQVQADDTMQKMGEATHTVYAQFVVDVLDVNNVTPEWRIVSGKIVFRQLVFTTAAVIVKDCKVLQEYFFLLIPDIFDRAFYSSK